MVPLRSGNAFEAANLYCNSFDSFGNSFHNSDFSKISLHLGFTEDRNMLICGLALVPTVRTSL